MPPDTRGIRPAVLLVLEGRESSLPAEIIASRAKNADVRCAFVTRPRCRRERLATNSTKRRKSNIQKTQRARESVLSRMRAGTPLHPYMHIHKCVLSHEGKRQRERERGEGTKRQGEGVRGRGKERRQGMSVRMHRARSGPSGVFKARSVAPSRGMRQSIITVLHIDTTVGHTGPRGAEPRASS